jgi:hypothetical protein
VNADKTKYMITSPGQNAGRSQYVKTDYSSLEIVDELWEQPKNQYSIEEEIKG